MDVEGISINQIITISAFLLALVALQIFVRKNKNKFSNRWRSNKRIHLIEEKALSSSEKLRIISVDSSQFLLISNKGKKSSVIPLGQLQKRPVSKSNALLAAPKSNDSTITSRQRPNLRASTKTKSPSENNREGHQLSKAIQTAREMNPAVSYKA